LTTDAKRGELYVCPTPIGNLEDMTFRAARILQEADLIAAEDTRQTRKLLNHFEIKTPLLSYHEHNKEARAQELLDKLAAGQVIALVSDAGMPGIADPGYDLIQLALQNEIRVTPLPGANAALTALIGSGLPTAPFTFIGFLPKTAKKRRELLNECQPYEHTLIFYESPHRLLDTLAEMADVLGERQVVAARELTKKFEEFVRGSFAELEKHFALNTPRGEFTLLVAGLTGQHEETKTYDREYLAQAVEKLTSDGTHKKDAIREIASNLGLPKRQVYQAVINKKV
jgi:16S rRNA (cytidine1402-2'-O)-methyltransferase